MPTPTEIADDIIANPYAWPGGYERWALTDEGGEVCSTCCAAFRDSIAESSKGDGWHVVGSLVACDVDDLSFCDSCGNPLLPSGYANVDEYYRENA